MDRSKNVRAFAHLAMFFTVVTLAVFPKPATSKAGEPQSQITAPTRNRWTPDRSLTVNPADPQLSYNFSRSVAADEAGRRCELDA